LPFLRIDLNTGSRDERNVGFRCTDINTGRFIELANLGLAQVEKNSAIVTRPVTEKLSSILPIPSF
jgi:hypothetical protein